MTKSIYTNGDYYKMHPTWHSEDSSWKAIQIITLLQRNNIHPKSVCEVGCGTGEILNQLYSYLPNKVQFSGYDVSPQAIELAKPKEKDRLVFTKMNILNEIVIYFDLIMAIDVIEHIEDYFTFLRNIREKGKYKIYHIPLDISVQEIIRRAPLARKWHGVGHLHYFTKDTALLALKATGHHIVDYFYTTGAIDHPAKSLLSLLAKMPRKLFYAINKDLAVRFLGGFSLIVLAE